MYHDLLYVYMINTTINRHLPKRSPNMENQPKNQTNTNTNANTNTNILTTIANRVRYSARFTIFCIIRIAYFLLYTYGFIPMPPTPITISSQSEDYIQLQHARFLESYTRFSQEDINSNIDKCFYDKKSYHIAVENTNNELENTWNRRILFENTPRGSVIMHYDAYKQGFVYYSDSSNIPYFVINAVIMKYVITFRCRDFFMDDQFTFNHLPSPLFTIYNTDTENIAKKNQNTPQNTPLKNNAFAKLKNYNTISSKVMKLSDNIIPRNNDSPSNDSTNHTRNKIIYSGKIGNFNLLQKPSNPQKHIPFTSNLTEELTNNSSLQSQVFTYRDFKKMRETIPTDK